MGTDSLAILETLKYAGLGIVGVTALIAVIMAILRYFFYDHLNAEETNMYSRVGHVAMTVAGIALVSSGATSLAQALMQNTISQQIAADAGTSLVPAGVAETTGASYSNLGEALQAAAAANSASSGAGISVDGSGMESDAYQSAVDQARQIAADGSDAAASAANSLYYGIWHGGYDATDSGTSSTSGTGGSKWYSDRNVDTSGLM